VAAEQDAARNRVLTARAALDEELDELRGSARAAVDIPAQVRRSPAKAAAIVGGLAFLILRGPQRLWRAVREKVFGRPARLPSRLLPKEIEKTLQKMGDDGDKVRGTLERDFAAYVKEKQKERRGLIPIVLLGLARPVIARAARRAGEFLVSPSAEGQPTNLDVLRARWSARAEEARVKAEMRVDEARVKAEMRVDEARSSAERAADTAKERVDRVADSAKERVDRVRGEAAGSNEEPPAGV
jgi:hypothetical protein